MTSMEIDVELCKQLAQDAHEGQTRSNGPSYITHPARVAALCQGDRLAQCVAWLHDVLEDTDYEPRDLIEAGVPLEVTTAVEHLTRRLDESYPDFIDRITSCSEIVRRVKILDIVDNLSDQPTPKQKAKYAAALQVLAGAG